MDEQTQEKLNRLSDFADKVSVHDNLPIVEELRAIREVLEVIAKKETPEPLQPEPRPEVQKVELLGAELLSIKGNKGDRGDQGDKGDQGERGLDGENGKDGVNGIDGTHGLDGKDGLDGKGGENGKDGSPDLPEQIREKLETLKEEDRLDASAIKGLDEKFGEVDKRIGAIPRGGARSSNAMNFYDLSSQTNGSLKAFTVPKNVTAVVFMSDFPGVLMEGNGFTLNGTRTGLTLTVTNAPSSGSQLLFAYSSVFNT